MNKWVGACWATESPRLHDLSGQGLGELESVSATGYRARPWPTCRLTHQQSPDPWQGGLDVCLHLGHDVMREARGDGESFALVVEWDGVET
jgi:hypothetical protein